MSDEQKNTNMIPLHSITNSSDKHTTLVNFLFNTFEVRDNVKIFKDCITVINSEHSYFPFILIKDQDVSYSTGEVRLKYFKNKFYIVYRDVEHRYDPSPYFFSYYGPEEYAKDKLFSPDLFKECI